MTPTASGSYDDRRKYRGRKSPANSQNREGSYRGRDSERREGGYASREGGYRGRDGERREGGYASREGSYRGRDGERREGGYASRESSYRGRDSERREGGYASREGGYRGRDGERREGGYRGRDGERRDGGYRGRDGEHREGGYERRGGERQDRGFKGRGRRADGPRRDDRTQGRRSGGFVPREDRPRGPEIPEEITADQLDPQARRALRSLSKPNGEATARHLVMAGLLLGDDPELAYQHAQAAVRRAGRIDVVREAGAITAYRSGRYAEALREVRTVRRLSGIDAHRPMEADCERGLGRPERALAVVAETDPSTIDKRQWVELQIVAAGARADMGQFEAGLLVLEDPIVRSAKTPLMRYRIDSVRADLLDALGRHEEAEQVRGRSPEPAEAPEDEDVVVFDLVSESAPEMAAQEAEDAEVSEPASTVQGEEDPRPAEEAQNDDGDVAEATRDPETPEEHS